MHKASAAAAAAAAAAAVRGSHPQRQQQGGTSLGAHIEGRAGERQCRNVDGVGKRANRCIAIGKELSHECVQQTCGN